MTAGTRKIREILNSRWFDVLAGSCSIVGFFWFVYAKFEPTGDQLATFVFWLCAAPAFVGLVVYSIRVRQENRAFESFTKTLHKVNHDYRNVLRELFGPAHSFENEEVRSVCEQRTLRSVCQKVAEIFGNLTHVKCSVTVKLITKDGGKAYCQTLVRDEDNSPREDGYPQKFEVGTGVNTAFDTALRYKPGEISYFYGADLPKLSKEKDKEKRYYNQRTNWEAFYKTAIVVPIRYIERDGSGAAIGSDDVGFLCVDAGSPHRLNDRYHVHILAAFADQMYNFMSLVRGRYDIHKQ